MANFGCNSTADYTQFVDGSIMCMVYVALQSSRLLVVHERARVGCMEMVGRL